MRKPLYPLREEQTGMYEFRPSDRTGYHGKRKQFFCFFQTQPANGNQEATRPARMQPLFANLCFPSEFLGKQAVRVLFYLCFLRIVNVFAKMSKRPFSGTETGSC
jgi:hypothetical protein